MNRFKILLSVSTLLLFCAQPEPRELTWNEYMDTWRELNKTWGDIQSQWEELESYYWGVYFRIPLAKPFLRQKIFSIARKVCIKNDVRFEDFNEASKLYGKADETYVTKVKDYVNVLRDILFSSKGVYYGESYIDKIIIDLGFCKDALLVEVDSRGRILIDGKPGSVKKINDTLRYMGIGSTIHFMLDPNVPASKLFNLTNSIPELRSMRCDLSLSEDLKNIFYKPSLYPEFSDFIDSLVLDTLLTVFIEVDSTGEIRLNSETIKNNDEFYNLVDSLMNRSIYYMVLISVQPTVPISKVLELSRLWESGHLYRIAILPSVVIHGKEPNLNTQVILAPH